MSKEGDIPSELEQPSFLIMTGSAEGGSATTLANTSEEEWGWEPVAEIGQDRDKERVRYGEYVSSTRHGRDVGRPIDNVGKGRDGVLWEREMRLMVPSLQKLNCSCPFVSPLLDRLWRSRHVLSRLGSSWEKSLNKRRIE